MTTKFVSMIIRIKEAIGLSKREVRSKPGETVRTQEAITIVRSKA